MNLNRIAKKIVRSANKLPKTLFAYHHLINELILINLETENILLKKNKNPKQGIFNLLVNLEKKIQIIKNTNKFGFKYFHQIIGGMPTDFDLISNNDKFFNEKFGSGDLRFITQK